MSSELLKNLYEPFDHIEKPSILKQNIYSDLTFDNFIMSEDEKKVLGIIPK